MCQTGTLNCAPIFLMLKLYETCFPNFRLSQPVPEYQIIKSPSSFYIRSQSKFFSPVEGSCEQECSSFDLIQFAMLSIRSRSSAELGKRASTLSLDRSFLVEENDIQSLYYGKSISLVNRLILKSQM